MNSIVISKQDNHYLVTIGMEIIRIFDNFDDAAKVIKESLDKSETKERWPNEPPDFTKEIMESEDFKEC